MSRPYYFKEIGYRYEHEVRFAFAVDMVLMIVDPGVVVEIDPNVLIQDVRDVRISPHILSDEAKVLRRLIDSTIGESRSIDLSVPIPTNPDVFGLAGFIADASPQAFRELVSWV